MKGCIFFRHIHDPFRYLSMLVVTPAEMCQMEYNIAKRPSTKKLGLPKAINRMKSLISRDIPMRYWKSPYCLPWNGLFWVIHESLARYQLFTTYHYCLCCSVGNSEIDGQDFITSIQWANTLGSRNFGVPIDQVVLQVIALIVVLIVVLRIGGLWPECSKWLLDRGTYCFEIRIFVWGIRIRIFSLQSHSLPES